MFEQESQALNVLLNHLDGAFKRGAFGLQDAFQITDATRTLAKFHEEGVVEVANRVLEGVQANKPEVQEQTYSTQPEPQLAQPPIVETLPATVEDPRVEYVGDKPVTEAPDRNTSKPKNR